MQIPLNQYYIRWKYLYYIQYNTVRIYGFYDFESRFIIPYLISLVEVYFIMRVLFTFDFSQSVSTLFFWDLIYDS